MKRMASKARMSRLTLAMLAVPLVACSGASDGSAAPKAPACELESFRGLPDVRLTSVARAAAPAPHCKVAGVIGTETSFELLLPDDWNGRFVMGGGGGFVGSVINTALGYGVLQKG